MAAIPPRLCLGTRKKIWWFWGLVVGSIIVSSLYMFESKDGSRGHRSRHSARKPVRRNDSLRHLYGEDTAWSKDQNSTVLRRKKEQILAELSHWRDSNGNTRGGCQPLDSVYMVKTHKCSSSTLQSILLRRAEDHRLRVALPGSGVYLSWEERFDRSSIFMDDGVTTYDIMASHMRLHEWDFGTIKQVMKNDAVWITILRDPARQFESLYTYYGWQSRYGVDLHGFLRYPERYYEGRDQGSPSQAGRNPMLYDNGLDARNLEFGDSIVSRFITAMDKRFDLVLLADSFDESLILLKDIMCWSIDDIAYISQNARPKDSVERLTDAEKAAIRRWNWGDYLLYDYFNRTLLNRIGSYGIGRMSEELVQLHRRKQELAEDCILKTLESGDERVWYPDGMKVTSFRADPNAKNPHLCEQLSRPELVFLEKMRELTVHGLGGKAGDRDENGGIENGGERFGDANNREFVIGNVNGDLAAGNENSEDSSPKRDIARIAGPENPGKDGGTLGSKRTGDNKVRIQRPNVHNGNPVNSRNLSIDKANVQKSERNADLPVEGREGNVGTSGAVDSQPASNKGSKSGNDPKQFGASAGIAGDERRKTVDLSGTARRGAEGESTCQPRDGIVMIKTHKCSSSTLQNVLLRRAEDRRLPIALPREGVYFHQQSKFDRRFIYRDDGRRKYDMMASHMKFDIDHFQGITNVMEGDVKYITILRDPATQYESMYTYYKYEQRYGANLRTFLQIPQSYFSSREDKRIFQAGRNPMCHDNGLDARFLEPGDAKVNGFVASLERVHDLVLIADHFDVSLILLKDLMCWSLEDVVYFKQNARSSRSVLEVSESERRAIRNWNWADTLIYDHFNGTLWKKVAIYGEERMARDVAALRGRNAQLAEDCVAETLDHGDQRMWYPAGVKVTSFLVNENAKDPKLCSQLTRPELGYLKKLRELRPYRGRNGS